MKGSAAPVDQSLVKGLDPPHQADVADDIDDPEQFLGRYA